MIDDGAAIHYAAVEPGTPVFAADGTELGVVEQVVDNYREHILDGVVVRAESGTTRFVDGPEVARTAERGVTLAIDAAAFERLPAPDSGPATYRANVRSGRLGRLFGGGWKRD